MLDIEYTKKAFQKYIQKFDCQNDKIQLKLIHTYCVVETSRYLCLHEGIQGDDFQLALIIALLHDIGRFEQLKRFNSFSDNNIDHALLGVKILFEEGLIKEMVQDRDYDDIIYTAIFYHSAYAIPDIKDKRQLLHTQLIRDSDKLDNFRVKNTASIETLFDIEEKQFLSQQVSSNIMDDIKNHCLIKKEDRHSEVDMWVSYFAFIFYLNFSSSYLFLKENDYIRKNIDRFSYQGILYHQMQEMKEECLRFIDGHIKNRDFSIFHTI